MMPLDHPLAMLVLLAGACSGETTGSGDGTGGATTVCQPGDSRDCQGPVACQGGQTCLSDGTWGSCDCGSPATGGSGAGGAAAGGSPSTGGSTTTGGSGVVACHGLAYSVGTGGDACTSTGTGDPPPLDMCEYLLPFPPGPPDVIRYDLVQVLRTPVDSPTEEVAYATTRGGCSAAYGGWYYDVLPSMGTPSKIITCPCTCASLATGTVDIVYGCRPQVMVLP
jgi:hypothetical protein